MPSPCGASSSYTIDMMLKFYFFLKDPRLQDFSCFWMVGGWTIPTLDSSAFVLFFLFFQLTVTNFTYQGQICFCKENLCEGNWWLLDGCWGLQLGFEYLRRFLYVFSALSCLDCFLHDAFCVVMCIYMTWQWLENEWYQPYVFVCVCVWECGFFYFLYI